MKRKIIQFKITTAEHYLRLFNGIYNLTPAERKVLAEFVQVDLSLQKLDSDVNTFSTAMRNGVARRMGKKSSYSLGTYIKALADKGAIKKVEGGYVINPHLLPGGEDEIVFKIK